MRKILTLIYILAGFTGLNAQSGGIRAYSMKQAVEFAIQNNISAKNAKLSETEAIAHNNELRAYGLPQLSGNFDYTYYLVRPTSPAITAAFSKVPGFSTLVPPGEKIYFVLPNNINTGINLSQMVYDPRFFIGIQTFKSLYKVSQLTTALTEQDIRYNVMKGYYETQAAREILRALDSNLLIVQKLLHDTRETYKAGLIEELDVNRLELGEAMLKSQINNTQNLYDLSMSSLKFNMGLQMTDQIALTDNMEYLRSQISSTGPRSFDPRQRIEDDLLETALALRSFDMKQKRAGYIPSVNALANFGGGSQVDYVSQFFNQDLGNGARGTNWFMQSYVGFSIKVPIYDGGAREATVKEAKIEVEKAKNDLENFKNQATLQVQAAQTTFNTNLIEEENARRSMALNDKIFNTTQIKFKNGISSSFELMQTQQDETTNQINYFTAVKNVLTSRADLDKALGIK